MKNITFEMRGSNGLKNTNFNFNFSHYSLGEWTIPNPTKNSPKIFIFRNRIYECPDTKNSNVCYLPLDEDTVHNQHYRRTWPKYHFVFEMKNILRKNSTFEPFIIDNFASGKAKKKIHWFCTFCLTHYTHYLNYTYLLLLLLTIGVFGLKFFEAFLIIFSKFHST